MIARVAGVPRHVTYMQHIQHDAYTVTLLYVYHSTVWCVRHSTWRTHCGSIVSCRSHTVVCGWCDVEHAQCGVMGKHGQRGAHRTAQAYSTKHTANDVPIWLYMPAERCRVRAVNQNFTFRFGTV